MCQSAKIGGNQKDKELMAEILKYMKENKFSCCADAVRDLCKFALQVKSVK